MSLTTRDLEESEQRHIKKPPFMRFFIAFLRFISKIPAINRYISGTIGGLNGRFIKLWNLEEYEKATKIAIYALEKHRNIKSKFIPFMDHYHWWNFMKEGVESASMVENEEDRRKLIQYANAGVEPFEGHYVAYSYLEFSRWEYKANNYEEAVKYAEIASNADNKWAEPDFILGWYGLLLSIGNAEEHLSKAIDKDQRILFRIVNDEICKQYPHIMNKLKEKYSVLYGDQSLIR